MQRLEVSCAVRRIYTSVDDKCLRFIDIRKPYFLNRIKDFVKKKLGAQYTSSGAMLAKKNRKKKGI